MTLAGGLALGSLFGLPSFRERPCPFCGESTNRKRGGYDWKHRYVVHPGSVLCRRCGSIYIAAGPGRDKMTGAWIP
jgi:hypothetical protein